MKNTIKHLIELWDIPGGAILGLWSVVMLAMCGAAFGLTATGHPTDIPPAVKEIFNWVLTMFAASKTAKTLFGKVIEPSGKSG